MSCSARKMSDRTFTRLMAKIHATPWPTDCELSPNERRCVEAASYGLTNAMIAEAFGVGIESVKTALRNASRKLGAKDRAHAVAISLRQGIIE